MMKKSKLLGQMLRLLITLAGAGIGAIAATMVRPFLQGTYPHLFSAPNSIFFLYIIPCTIGGVILFAFSYPLMQHVLRLSGTIEHRFSSMPNRQIFLTASGLILGLVVAALIHLLILSMGSSLLTVSISAIVYVVLGTMGMRIGYQRYYSKPFSTHGRKHKNTLDILMDETMDENEEAQDSAGDEQPCTAPAKVLDTSVLIDGRILDIADTGFLEGDLIIAEFVLDELRHIADSADSLKRTRGRRGLDIVKQLQNRLGDRVVIHTPTYPDDSEVDVRLLKLCRELGGIVVTNDYNLNKVARISGVKALNINDLANALKPMLATGEEITVEIVREGKETGQGVAYLDDGTMIVVDHAKPLIGRKADIMVTTVLQTSAGRMIFASLKETASGKEA